MTDKSRDLTPQGNAPSWVDEVLASEPAAPRPVEGRHGGVSGEAPHQAAPAQSVRVQGAQVQSDQSHSAQAQSGWQDWPQNDPARDLRLPGDPPRPAAPGPDALQSGTLQSGTPRFDADDWVARATGGQARDPRVGGAAQTTSTTYAAHAANATHAAAPQTDAWSEAPRSGSAFSTTSATNLPLREDIAQKKLIAGLLGIFLGSLGVHKFYLGQNTAGLLMLGVNLGVWALAIVLSLLTLGFGAIVLFPLAGLVSSALGVIGLIEGIVYLTKSDADFQRDYLYGKKAWF